MHPSSSLLDRPVACERARGREPGADRCTLVMFLAGLGCGTVLVALLWLLGG
jgi:hypothetical protein